MNFPESSSSSLLVGQVAVPLIVREVGLRVAPVTEDTVIVASLRVLEIVQVTVAATSVNLLDPPSAATVAAAKLHVGVTPDGDDNVTVTDPAVISASVTPVIVKVYTELEHEPVFTLFKVIVQDDIVINNKINRVLIFLCLFFVKKINIKL